MSDSPLFLPTGQAWQNLQKRLSTEPLLQGLLSHLQRQAVAWHAAPALAYELEGRRLLAVSRICLKRVLADALLYRLHGDTGHLQSARRTMLTVAAFPDWNPSHFLDVAEMATALAIGLSWLGDELSSADQQAIIVALRDKALLAVDEDAPWLRSQHNWNQVCHTGLALAALAIKEHEPELAEQVIQRSVTLLPLAMQAYEPDGVYPEGPMYWEYGTSYNVLLFEALRSSRHPALAQLPCTPAFLRSAEYVRHMLGPTGLFFNFSDSHAGRQAAPCPALHWFARELRRPDLLDHQYALLPDWLEQASDAQGARDGGQRFLPFLLLWTPEQADDSRMDRDRYWSGGGHQALACWRSDWTESATFLACKGGSPGLNHGHMDVGSFVLDAAGHRWAVDLGADHYHSLETAGVALWDRSQAGERWTVFRYSPQAHTTLIVDDGPQLVDGCGQLLAQTVDQSACELVWDVQPVYADSLRKACRTIRCLADGRVLIRDVCQPQANKEGAVPRIRWNWVTGAVCTRISDAVLQLSLGNQHRYLCMQAPLGSRWQFYQSEPERSCEKANPGITVVGFEFLCKQSCQVQVCFTDHPDRCYFIDDAD